MKKAIIIVAATLLLVAAVFPYSVFAADGGFEIKEVGKYIYGVPERTAYSSFARAYHRTGYIVMGIEGAVVSDSSTFIGTNFTLRFESGIGEYTTLSFVVLGDIDGNGRVASADYLNIRAHLKGTNTLNEIQRLAADINGDEGISTFDYMLVKSHFLGTYDIYENQKLPDSSEPVSSAEPTTDPWTSGWT